MTNITKQPKDENGYFYNPWSIDTITEPWKKHIAQISQRVSQIIGNKLISIYTVGSVSRGQATIGVSDIDMKIILTEELSEKTKSELKAYNEKVDRDTKIASKHDFDYYVGSTLLDGGVVKSLYQQFSIVVSGVLVFGQDLSGRLHKFKPVRDTVKIITFDFENKLTRHFPALQKTTAIEDRHKIYKYAMKDYLRFWFALVLEQSGEYVWKFSEIVDICKQYIPSKSNNFDFALSVLNHPSQAEIGRTEGFIREEFDTLIKTLKQSVWNDENI